MTRVRRLVVANGPNLNLLGSREPEIYGGETLAAIEDRMRARATAHGVELSFFQTNHEGVMLDRLQSEAPGSDGVIINPGALTHQSYALYDCLKALAVPVLEVHLSNLYARAEAFRPHSLTAPAVAGVIMGLGGRGYILALEWFIDRNE